jgi:hypothetical protein
VAFEIVNEKREQTIEVAGPVPEVDNADENGRRNVPAPMKSPGNMQQLAHAWFISAKRVALVSVDLTENRPTFI